MLTELEQSANNEARHAHRELVRKMALDYLDADWQAQEAYQAQLAAEAKLADAEAKIAKAVEALKEIESIALLSEGVEFYAMLAEKGIKDMNEDGS